MNQECTQVTALKSRFALKLLSRKEIQIVPDYTELFAKLYDSRDVQTRNDIEFYHNIANSSTALKKVADLGAGTGAISEVFANAGHSVIALDSSDQMLERLRNKIGGHTNVTPVVGSFESFSLAQRQDLFILGKNNLYYLNNPSGFKNFLNRVKESSSPAAQLIIDFERIHPAHFWAQWGADFNEILVDPFDAPYIFSRHAVFHTEQRVLENLFFAVPLSPSCGDLTQATFSKEWRPQVNEVLSLLNQMNFEVTFIGQEHLHKSWDGEEDNGKSVQIFARCKT